jgi:hypothetical protein
MSATMNSMKEKGQALERYEFFYAKYLLPRLAEDCRFIYFRPWSSRSVALLHC